MHQRLCPARSAAAETNFGFPLESMQQAVTTFDYEKGILVKKTEITGLRGFLILDSLRHLSNAES